MAEVNRTAVVYSGALAELMKERGISEQEFQRRKQEKECVWCSYAEGESRTGESEDVGCRVNSSTGTGVGTSVETLGRKSGVNRRGQKGENEGVGEEGERRGRPRTLGGGRRNSH